MRFAKASMSVLLALSLVPGVAFAMPASTEGEAPGGAAETLVMPQDAIDEGSVAVTVEEGLAADVVETQAEDTSTLEALEDEELDESTSDLAACEDAEIEAFVTRLYRLVLGREPDAEGLANQVAGVKQSGAAQIAFNFFASGEYSVRIISNEARVELMYRVMFDREPDATGMAMWTGYLENGKSDLDIVAGFAESDEFRTQCAKWGVAPGDASTLRRQIAARDENPYITSFVKRLYSCVLEREPDVEGLTCQANALRSGVSAAQIAMNFFNSDEFANRPLSNEERVEIAYNALLNRNSDEDGLAYWTEGLDLQMTIEYVVAGFCNSPEFGNNCSKWGVTPGSVAITLERNRSIDVTRAVTAVYETLLHRAPDIDGLEHWCRVCRTDGYVWVCSGLAQSGEATVALPAGEDMATALYQLCVGRRGYAEDIATWAAYFDKGGFPSALISELSSKAECIAHCRELGVTKGTMVYYDVSRSHDLNLKIADIIQTKTGTDLFTCFNYVAGFQYYKRDYWPSYEGWMEDYALRFIIDGGGNCYGYAALFTYLARVCGYDADVHQGTVVNTRGGLSNHGWTEIYADGTTYVCDPELYWELEVLSFMVTYDNAPFVYNR